MGARADGGNPTVSPEEIRQLRQRYGETQQEFAVRLGVVVRTVAGWEAGTASPSKMAMRALSEAKRKAPRRKRA